MFEQNGNSNKEISKRYSETKSKIIEVKYTLEDFKKRFEEPEERISKFEDRTIEIIESEGQKEKNKEEWTYGTVLSEPTYVAWNPSRKKKGKGQKKYF